MKQKKFILQESEIPTQWYNIQADMPNKPLPPLNPKTHQLSVLMIFHTYSIRNVPSRNWIRSMRG